MWKTDEWMFLKNYRFTTIYGAINENLIKMSSDFNFPVTSWVLENVCVKPYFNTQCVCGGGGGVGGGRGYCPLARSVPTALHGLFNLGAWRQESIN